jgi:hypothetical protein
MLRAHEPFATYWVCTAIVSAIALAAVTMIGRLA